MTTHISDRTSHIPSLLFWSGLFCLSFTWLFTLDLYTLERDAWWVVLLVLGILCNSAACRGKVVLKVLDKKYLLLLVPLVLSLLILPFPYQLGIIVAIAGIIMLFLCPVIPFFSFPFMLNLPSRVNFENDYNKIMPEEMITARCRLISGL